MILVFFGPPGSGKDTQADLLCDDYGFINISSGEMFRKELSHNTELGKKAAKFWQKGALVPSEIVYEILEKRFLSEQSENIILNGLVRTYEQIEMLDQLLSKVGKKLDFVVYIEITQEVAVERLSGRLYTPSSGKTYHEKFYPPKNPGIDDETGEALIKRDDDKPEIVSQRFLEYVKNTEAILNEYQNRNILIKIDGDRTVEIIHKAIVEALNLNVKIGK